MTVPGAVKDPLILTHFTLCQASQGGGDQFDNRHFLYSVECSVVLTLVKEWVWGGGDGI